MKKDFYKLLGIESITVSIATMLPSGPGFSTISVGIKHLAISDFPALYAAQENEISMVKIFTDLSDSDIDCLPNDSIEAIINAGEEANGDFFGRWMTRKDARQARMLKGMSPELMAAASSALTSGSRK